jgi:DNA-binding NarL/FixJ family response regulator
MPTATSTPTPTRPAVPKPVIPGLRRIVVADDHPVYRDGIVRALLETGRYDVAGQAGDGEAAFDLIQRSRPHVALVDLRMPKLDGLGLIRRLEGQGLHIPLVLLSAFPQLYIVERALAAGAAAYMSKDASRERIVAALDAAGLDRPVLERPVSIPPDHTGWADALAESQRRAAIGRERERSRQAAASEAGLVTAWLRRLANR